MAAVVIREFNNMTWHLCSCCNDFK